MGVVLVDEVAANLPEAPQGSCCRKGRGLCVGGAQRRVHPVNGRLGRAQHHTRRQSRGIEPSTLRHIRHLVDPVLTHRLQQLGHGETVIEDAVAAAQGDDRRFALPGPHSVGEAETRGRVDVVGESRLAFEAEAVAEGQVRGRLPVVFGVDADVIVAQHRPWLAGRHAELRRLSGEEGGCVRKNVLAVEPGAGFIGVAYRAEAEACANRVLAMFELEEVLQLVGILVVAQDLRGAAAVLKGALHDYRR